MDSVQIISAYLHNRNDPKTATVYQYNQGMILRIIGPALPTAYEVDFANSITGQSITQIGGAEGVSIPDQFFVPGSMIHAWVVLVGEDYVVTRYHIMIPISPRAVRTSEEPTPSQQGAIDQAIAALNQAVEDAETAITHYPRINAGYWEVWNPATGAYESTGVAAQGPQGDPGLDGVSPAITVASIPGGHRITITDADGTKTVDVMDGDDGVGISSIVKTGTSGLVDTYTITYTNGQTATFNVTNGEDGVPGVSPSVTVTDITGGHRVTITDADGSKSFDVMDGQGGVTDVQVNGTSVVSSGVANVPVASANAFGVSGINANYGVGITNGFLKVQSAGSSDAKNGTNQYNPITPSIQEKSSFYALAKAAGADMKDIASTTVGVYPEAQKSAISQMLTAPVTVTGSTPTITALPGIQYVCGEVSTLDITLPASGCVDVVFESGSTATVLSFTLPTAEYTLAWENGFNPASLEANTTYEINIKIVGTKCLGVAGSWT